MCSTICAHDYVLTVVDPPMEKSPAASTPPKQSVLVAYHQWVSKVSDVEKNIALNFLTAKYLNNNTRVDELLDHVKVVR